MRLRSLAILTSLLLLALAAFARPAADRNSVVIVFKDGHRQSFSIAEIAHIDLKSPSVVVFRDGHQEKLASADIASIDFESSEFGSNTPSRSHFIGKWEVGDGNGNNFFITLDADGKAHKTTGSHHGTWTLFDGEARISWDDGWHDIIRKVGAKHEKIAFAPGKSFTDPPSNIANARNTEPKPI